MVFEQYWHLARNPFDKTLPARDAFATRDFREATSRLDFLARAGGIGLLTAPPGAGKTYALRAWSSSLNPNSASHVYICLSTVSPVEFYRQLCQGLGIEPAYRKSDMFRQVQEHLRYRAVDKGLQTVVTLDEAQYLSHEILRDLKMLANFDMDSRDCLALVLAGQPVLADVLSRTAHEALAQRVVVSYAFRGIQADEAAPYVEALLRGAGASPSIFDPAAVAAAHGCCNGSVRRLNQVLTGALRIGAQQGAASVDAEMVLSASQEASLR